MSLFGVKCLNHHSGLAQVESPHFKLKISAIRHEPRGTDPTPPIQNAAFETTASHLPVWLLKWEHALSRRPSSVCTNEDFGALLSLHGGHYKPHVKCLPKKKEEKKKKLL